MSRTLEITVLSGEDLRIDRKPVRKNVFAVVKIDPFNFRTTRPDETGGSYPTWNESLEMEMPMNGRVQFVSIEAFCRMSSGNKQKVGFARMPVTDFMGGYAPEGYLHFLSYRLRDESGDRNGIINVSVRVKVDERLLISNVEKKKPTPVDFGACSSQATGFWRPVPVVPSSKETNAAVATAGGFSGGVVEGVPVWCGYHARV